MARRRGEADRGLVVWTRDDVVIAYVELVDRIRGARVPGGTEMTMVVATGDVASEALHRLRNVTGRDRHAGVVVP